MRNLEATQNVQKFIEISVKNDVEGFLKCIQLNPACVDDVGVWSRWLRTPLMVAASCGSLEIVQQILIWFLVDVNRQCGPERVTALHCAASSGSPNAAAILRLLLNAGADPYISDEAGIKPQEVIVMSSLQVPSMVHLLWNMLDPSGNTPGTDEFVIETFKVYACLTSEDHNLDECPYYHVGRGDQRRNPRRYSYSKEKCRYINRFVTCPRMDMCGKAHGLLERVFHPDLYKTRHCRNGRNCVYKTSCWYAHSLGELRNLPRSPIRLADPDSYPYSYEQQKRILNEMQSSNSHQ